MGQEQGYSTAQQQPLINPVLGVKDERRTQPAAAAAAGGLASIRVYSG